MIVRELISLLEDSDPDATVLLVHQPGWPLQNHVLGVFDASDDEPSCTTTHEILDCAECGPPEANLNVYIVEGDHPSDSPYGPRQAWDQVRTA